MALSNFMKQDWTQRHFWLRIGGLSGCVVAGLGLILILSSYTWAGVVIAILGGLVAGTWFVVEILAATESSSSRAGLARSFTAVQVGLAAVLLVEVNAFSFIYYHRFDLTGREFTIPADLREQLSQIRGDTLIVLHLTHNFGQLSDQRDDYDYAAERVVIDRVEDLAEEFREFGPQFQVQVLDVKDKRYREKLKDLARHSKKLPAAIDGSKEDSVFILAQDKVQRLGFQELFQLDKQASMKADDNRGNLILNYQGEGAFVRKILNLDERRPRVALGVIHEVLTSRSDVDGYTLAGLKKTLVARGFATRDIILKKWTRVAPPEPAVLTFDQTKYEELQSRIAESQRSIERLEEELRQLHKLLKRWQNDSPTKLSKDFAAQLDGRKVTEEIRTLIIDQNLKPRIQIRTLELDDEKADRAAAQEAQRQLNVGDLAEQNRDTDLKSRLARQLDDCDLLILPRLTLRNAAVEDYIPNRVHLLDPAQVSAIKDFLRKGKPVLLCFGPTNNPEGAMPQDMMHGRGDGVEEMFGELGIHFGKETVLFHVETKSYGERRGALLFMGVHTEVPAVKFGWEAGGQVGLRSREIRPHRKANPIAESMDLTMAGLDPKTQTDLALHLRNPRPIEYRTPPGERPPPYDPTFLMTDPKGWKEKQPFAAEGQVPRPDPESSGQVSIGVAVNAYLPKDWQPDRTRVRIAVIGQGGVFNGKQLNPVQQKLLADTCNWLLGRDDQLTHKNEVWAFPRVHVSSGIRDLWQWGALLGLPMIFGYTGIIVLLKRSLR